MALTDNIVSYWKLDGNSTDAVSTNNGTDTAITYSLANGKINQGAGFNGSSSQINVGTGANLNISGAITINAWVNIPNTTQYYFIVTREVSAGGTTLAYEFRIDQTTGKLNFVGVGTNLNSTGAVGTGAFHMVTVTSDASNNVAFYIDGSASGTGTNTTRNSTPSNATRIGTRDDLFTFFNGAVDEVGIWSRALSSAEVTQLYNSGAGLQYPFSTNVAVLPYQTLLGVGI